LTTVWRCKKCTYAGEDQSDEPFEHPQGQPNGIFEHPVGGNNKNEERSDEYYTLGQSDEYCC